MEGLLGLLVVLVVLLVAVMGVRHRVALLHCMRVDNAYDLKGKRRKVTLKRVIEDAEAELKILNKKEEKAE